MKKRLPFAKAILYIVLSLVIVALLATGGYRGYRHYRRYISSSPKFAIKEIAQSSGTSERLSTSYLSETMGLSSNVPTQLTTFNVYKAKERLSQSPMIKYAHVKKRRPGMLAIRYLMRTPIALLGDIYNGALDEEGVVFPLSPYYAPKKLPELYLGEEVDRFGKHIQTPKMLTAFDVLSLLKETVSVHDFEIESIDVSQISHPSLGRRAIVVVISSEFSRHYIRLHYKQYEQSIANYLEMQGELFFQERESYQDKKIEKIIDLRIPGYAYVDNVN